MSWMDTARSKTVIGTKTANPTTKDAFSRRRESIAADRVLMTQPPDATKKERNSHLIALLSALRDFNPRCARSPPTLHQNKSVRKTWRASENARKKKNLDKAFKAAYMCMFMTSAFWNRSRESVCVSAKLPYKKINSSPLTAMCQNVRHYDRYTARKNEEKTKGRDFSR